MKPVVTRVRISQYGAASSSRPDLACRNNLCEMLEMHRDCVNVKAKTHEKVDSLGEERSIACHTVILLIANKA